LTHLCVKGVLTSFTDMLCAAEDVEYSVETKLYIAWFIRRVVSVESTLQTLFTCCGLPLLVELIVPDYGEENKELNRITIDCIHSILELKPQVGSILCFFSSLEICVKGGCVGVFFGYGIVVSSWRVVYKYVVYTSVWG
jgi:hypothetical protein